MDNQVVIVVIVITDITVDTIIHVVVGSVNNNNYILEIINFIKK
jgi:hypothetical protein